LEVIIERLVAQESLDERFRDHALIGEWKGFRECHVQPDWLLIYRIEEDELELARTGSHAQLFA
jgi:mRNA interferase YafQ